MNRMIQWVLAATLICGASMFTACSTNDLPVDPNPLAKQVSGLWWSLNDEEGTCGEGDASQSYTRMGQAVCFNEDGTGYGASFFFNDEESDRDKSSTNLRVFASSTNSFLFLLVFFIKLIVLR